MFLDRLVVAEWGGTSDGWGPDWVWVHWEVLGPWTFQPSWVSGHCSIQQEDVDWGLLLQRWTQT